MRLRRPGVPRVVPAAVRPVRRGIHGGGGAAVRRRLQLVHVRVCGWSAGQRLRMRQLKTHDSAFSMTLQLL